MRRIERGEMCNVTDPINRTIRAQLAYEGKNITQMSKYIKLNKQSVFNRFSGLTD